MNELRLIKVRPKYDLRKYSFANRIVNIWNSLPNWVVSANSTNTFKNRLDKYWENQDIIMISKLSCTESEVAVNVEKIIRLNSCIILWYMRGGHRGISLRLHIRSTSTSTSLFAF